MMYHLTACPICHSHNLQPFLTCTDFTVSHETFEIQKCGDCGMLMTNPRPDVSELPAYYASEQYISHANKSRSPLDIAYRMARHFTLKWKYQILVRNAPRTLTSVLDYGCGTGAFLKTCSQRGLTIAGIEPSPKARQIAIQLVGNQVFADTKSLNATFDAITLWHVLEHVPKLNETLQDLTKHLNPDGTLIVAVPNPDSLDAKRYQQHWAGYDVPRHLWHFTENTMNRLLEANNLKLQAVLPMKLDAFYVSLLSEKYMAGRHNIFNMAQALRTGWNSNYSATKTTQYSSLIYIIRK